MDSKLEILITLAHSKLAEDLSAEDIALLAGLVRVQHYELDAGELTMDGSELQDALMILVSGEIEILATVNNDRVALELEHPGDMARIISFVGGPTSVEACIKVRRDSTVLLLKRTTLEGMLDTHPRLAYYVMRNLVRHMHGVVRRSNTEKVEMANYMYSTHGRY